MSKELVTTDFGTRATFKGRIVQVNQIAAKQKYIISKQDEAGNHVCFADETGSVVNEGGFQVGELTIQDWKLGAIATIEITEDDSLNSIIDKISNVSKVHAEIFQDGDGYRIIVESKESGVKNTFYLTGSAITNLKVVVPSNAVKYMDIYNESGEAFSSMDNPVDGMQLGTLNIGNGYIIVEPYYLTSLNLLKLSINTHSNATNVEANIIPFEPKAGPYILRLTAKLGYLNYTNSEVFTGKIGVQLQLSAASDTDLIIDDIPTSSSIELVTNSFLDIKVTEVLGQVCIGEG